VSFEARLGEVVLGIDTHRDVHVAVTLTMLCVVEVRLTATTPHDDAHELAHMPV
jgi:hypothetical protein